MDDTELLRYSRHILLPQLDLEGQERLLRARVAIVGLGGLGSPVAMYLAAAGVGHLSLVDPDVVELSNLQRQVVHASPDLGRPKVESARERLAALNPGLVIDTVAERLDGPALAALAAGVDVLVDATDNFPSRFALNAASLAAGTPLVSGAAIRFEGQVTVFRPREAASPCYRCLYAESDEPAGRCGDSGVLAPLLGIVGSIQATEVLKLLSGAGEPLQGRLLLIDAAAMDFRSLRFRRDPHCPACGHRPTPP